MSPDPFPYTSAEFRYELERSKHVRFWRVLIAVLALVVIVVVSALVVLSPF